MTKTTIVDAEIGQMPIVRKLFEEYQERIAVDLCFQGFAEELATLPGRYSPPRGFVLLAKKVTDYCGCVAVRPIDNETAELKRLFVRPEFRGLALGTRLFNRAMEQTQQLGYRSIVLDTLPMMETAQDMYRQYGFYETLAYAENPIEGVKYFRYDFCLGT